MFVRIDKNRAICYHSPIIMQIKNSGFLEKLKKSVFTEKEAMVYLSVLELGGAYPSRITEYCGLNRSTVYKILTDLSVRGLVNEIEKRNKLYYQIEKPDRIVRYAKSRVTMANEQLEQLEKIIPEFEGIFSQNPNKPVVRYFENADGINAIYEEMVSQKKKYEMISFSHGQAFKDYLPAKSLYKFVKAKERFGITTRAIIPDTAENRKYDDEVFKGIKKDIWPNIRFVPKEVFPFEAEMTLYDNNKLAITKLTNEKLIGIVIEDKLVHDMFKMIFELLWKSNQVHV